MMMMVMLKIYIPRIIPDIRATGRMSPHENANRRTPRGATIFIWKKAVSRNRNCGDAPHRYT